MPLELENAFDMALAQIEGLVGSGMKTVEGASARPQLEKLEKELKRKDAALAETAALLVPRKKAVALWGEEGEDT